MLTGDKGFWSPCMRETWMPAVNICGNMENDTCDVHSKGSGVCSVRIDGAAYSLTHCGVYPAPVVNQAQGREVQLFCPSAVPIAVFPILKCSSASNKGNLPGKAEKPWWDIESEFPYTSVSRVDLLGFSCKQLRCSYGTFTLVGQAWKPWFTRSGFQIASRVPQWRCDQLCQGGQREAILWWNYYSLVAGAGALEVKKRSGGHLMKQGATMGKDG